MELGGTIPLEPFRDVGHDRDRSSLNLPTKPEIPRKRLRSCGLVYLLGQCSGLLPGNQIFENPCRLYLSLFYEIDGVLGNYIRGILLEALAVGTLSAAGLMWLGVENAALISAAAGIGNIIPYLGPSVGGVLGFSVAFFQFQNVVVPLKVLGVFAAVQFIDNWFLEPFIMKRSVDLHPVIVLLALMCGGQIAGFWGVLLAVPVAGVIHELMKILAVWYSSEYRRRSIHRDLWEASAKPWIV